MYCCEIIYTFYFILGTGTWQSLSYPQGPTPHWVCMWMCPHPASGGPAASRCVSRSQISGHTFARRRGTNAHRCSRCSSRCQGGCTGRSLMSSPVRWCGKWHQTAHRHWGENNREQCVCAQHLIWLWAKDLACWNLFSFFFANNCYCFLNQVPQVGNYFEMRIFNLYYRRETKTHHIKNLVN